ncbi:MAG TPA: mannose-1-phosphate guanylyltransferase [Phycisphaerae bacterium]|nr:mannose-1-phosphate guanylyltransferase [Phycisphaerae bacterium]HNU45232.1 mannose-1-phosphate guanylyltransferase [Phycisphaerae bacterium]
MEHAVIMAGGGGTRLWPLSRAQRPKQLLRLFDKVSLLRLSYERAAALLPAERIYVITLAGYLPLVAEELPELPGENLLDEPVPRDTANAVALSAAILARRDPDAVLAVLTADQLISPLAEFRRAVETGLRLAREYPDALVTFGIRPQRAETQFGYVRRGKALAPGVYEVEKFTEKPTAETAEQYIRSGNYYWNSGMFAWRAETILAQLRERLPAAHEAGVRLAATWGTPQGQRALAETYPALPKISIDFAVLEQAPRVLVVEMDCQWQDVGSWAALARALPADADGNVNAAGQVVQLRSRGNLVVSEQAHLIATLGVQDLVIVHAADATLICHKDQAANLKELLGLIGEGRT